MCIQKLRGLVRGNRQRRWQCTQMQLLWKSSHQCYFEGFCWKSNGSRDAQVDIGECLLHQKEFHVGRYHFEELMATWTEDKHYSWVSMHALSTHAGKKAMECVNSHLQVPVWMRQISVHGKFLGAIMFQAACSKMREMIMLKLRMSIASSSAAAIMKPAMVRNKLHCSWDSIQNMNNRVRMTKQKRSVICKNKLVYNKTYNWQSNYKLRLLFFADMFGPRVADSQTSSSSAWSCALCPYLRSLQAFIVQGQ